MSIAIGQKNHHFQNFPQNFTTCSLIEAKVLARQKWSRFKVDALERGEISSGPILRNFFCFLHFFSPHLVPPAPRRWFSYCCPSCTQMRRSGTCSRDRLAEIGGNTVSLFVPLREPPTSYISRCISSVEHFFSIHFRVTQKNPIFNYFGRKFFKEFSKNQKTIFFTWTRRGNLYLLIQSS